ncbi:MAG: alginate O-acetyltransferase complex protein AlgJ [Verrucomicrobiota bacterium]|jgi:alginate O-acetyltransferase complex protein AlgJ
MRFFASFLLLAVSAASLSAQTAQQKFAAELAATVATLEKKNVAATTGADGWLFFGGELRLLSLGRFWGSDAAKVSRAHKADLADPVPAMVDFHQQLKARGIELIVVPVPPKASVYPEKMVPGHDVRANDPAAVLHQFYDELRAAGLNVLDLGGVFLEKRDDPRGPVFCKTDSHWSGLGCVLAAQAIAEKIRPSLPTGAKTSEYVADWKEAQISGDLDNLLAKDGHKPGPEKIPVQVVSEKATHGVVEPDANSPVLLLGDSHTLVYHDFLAERAGLLDQLALQLGFAPDLIGTRGSGATPVRVNLYRRSVKDAGYLAKKKVIVWCFAAREFTEATEGWAKVPIAK